MADVSNLKINERLNIERPNLPESLQQERHIEVIKHRNYYSLSKGRKEIQQIASGVKYRFDEWFQNLRIFEIWIVFETEKILKICQSSKL